MTITLNSVGIPEGQVGPWRVERWVMTETDAWASSLRAALNPQRPYRAVPVGTYTKLTHNGSTIMSDTPDELRDFQMAVLNAKGHILINGLGLGCVVISCLRRPEVETATVIEIDPNVIALIGPHIIDDRLTIINGDAFQYKPPTGQRYQMVWHDIWDTICSDNLPQMHQLHRKYGRRTDWQGSWSRELCEWQRDKL